MRGRKIQCVVTDQATAMVYDVLAEYRTSCPYPHDSRDEHLCGLTLRVRSLLRQDETPLVACEIAAVPTAVLIAIQSRLRDLLAPAVTTIPAAAR